MSPRWLLKEIMEKKAWNLLCKSPESQVGKELRNAKWVANFFFLEQELNLYIV